MGFDSSYIEKKTSELYNTLRNDEQAGFYSGLLILIVLIFLGVVLFHFIKYDFTFRLAICMIILFLMLILYKVNMQSAYKKSAALNNYEHFKEENEGSYYSGFLNFLESGTEIKRVRTKSVKNIYIYVFPLFLFLLAEVYKGTFESKSMIFALLLAFGLSWIVWRMVFNAEMEQWEDLEDEINMLRRKVLS